MRKHILEHLVVTSKVESERASKTEVSRQFVYMVGRQSEPDTDHLGCRVDMGRLTEKPNRYPIFLKTDTDTDVGISKTENRPKITEKTDTVGYFPISYLPQVTTLLSVFTAKRGIAIACRLTVSV